MGINSRIQQFATFVYFFFFSKLFEQIKENVLREKKNKRTQRNVMTNPETNYPTTVLVYKNGLEYNTHTGVLSDSIQIKGICKLLSCACF